MRRDSRSNDGFWRYRLLLHILLLWLPLLLLLNHTAAFLLPLLHFSLEHCCRSVEGRFLLQLELLLLSQQGNAPLLGRSVGFEKGLLIS
jgi:hypothetical protein